MKTGTPLTFFFLLALVACGTPDIARDYEAKTYVPEELGAALSADDPARRADAAEQILAMKPEQRKKVLVELVRDPKPEVRLMAVSLLGKHHAADAGVIAVLGGEAALDVDIDVRSGALAALAESGSVDALVAIGSALTDDPSLRVRGEAAMLLDRLTGQTLGAGFASRVEEAGSDADDAAMAYDDWLETNRARLRWDVDTGRFVIEGEAKP